MKVSVLIPAYNAEKYICRCLDSLLMQTFKNFELLIVNDGSTDNTQTLLENYANRFHDYHIFSIANGGSANARNMLLNEAQGEYVCFIDADDYVANTLLEKTIPKMEKDDMEKALNEIVYKIANNTQYKIANNTQRVIPYLNAQRVIPYLQGLPENLNPAYPVGFETNKS